MTNPYQRLKELFKEYLDNSQDSSALLLEWTPLIYNLWGYNEYLTYDKDEEKRFLDSIRTMWDIAYNYGFHDAISELAPEKSLTYE